MFVCQDCINKMGMFAMSVSYGPCEECGKTGSCADISASSMPAKEDSKDSENSKRDRYDFHVNVNKF
jgi:hypothetical protein